MKILLDECVDVELRAHIVAHDVFTVSYMGWKGLKNGELLAKAVADGFEGFVTTDRGVPYQQHVVTLAIAVIVLHSTGNSFAKLKPFIPALLATLNHVRPGTVTHVKP